LHNILKWTRLANPGLFFVIVIEINSKSCFGTLMAFGFIIGD